MTKAKKPRSGKSKASLLPERPEPTENEKEAIAAARESFNSRPSRPSCSLSFDAERNAASFQSAHNDDEGFARHLGDALGSRQPGFRHHMIHLICNAVGTLGNGQPSENAVNAAFAILAAVGPKDEIEGILGAQIAATNDLSLELIAAAKRSKTVEATAAYINQATKLQRTMCTQLETLAKLRRGGEQVVRHIHVDNRGGQAVIAENVHTGGGNGKGDDQSHGQGAFSPALLSQNPLGYGLQMPRDKGEEAVSAPWRPESGSAARQ